MAKRRVYDPHRRRYIWEEVPAPVSMTQCPFNAAVDCEDYVTGRCDGSCGWHPLGHLVRVTEIREEARRRGKIII